jgi:hypothetical protein
MLSGRLYICEDSHKWFFDHGTYWQDVTPTGGGGLPAGVKVLFNSKAEVSTDYTYEGMLANWMPCYRIYDATQSPVTVSGVYSTPDTIITASHSSFQNSDVGELLVIDDIGSFTVNAYYSPVSIRVTGDATCAFKKFTIAGRKVDRRYFTERSGGRALENYNGEIVYVGGITGIYPDMMLLAEWWTVQPDTATCNICTRGEDKVWHYDKIPPFWFSEPFFVKFEFACASRKVEWDSGSGKWLVSGIAAGGWTIDGNGNIVPTDTVYLYDPNELNGHYWQRGANGSLPPVVNLPVALVPAFGGTVYMEDKDEEKFVVCGYCGAGFKVYFGNGREEWIDITSTLPAAFEAGLRFWATGFSINGAFYVAYGTVSDRSYGAHTVWELRRNQKLPDVWEWLWTRMEDSPDIERAYAFSYVNEKEKYAVIGGGYNAGRQTLGSVYKFEPPSEGFPGGKWSQMSDYPGIGVSNAAGVAANTYASATVISKSEGFVIAGDVELTGSLTRSAAIFKQANLFVARKK